MPGRILIVDAVATNRIALRARMSAAQFQVEAFATPAAARAMIANSRPDLILINLADADRDRQAFCTALKADTDTRDIAIIAVGILPGAPARLAALQAGADDVLTRPLSEALLLARIRSLLRARAATQELALRDGSSHALGFADTQASFDFPACGHVSVIADDAAQVQDMVTALTCGLHQPVQIHDATFVLRLLDATSCADLFILRVTDPDRDPSALYSLVSDLRSRLETRHAAILVVVPDAAQLIAALFLDLGADDVVAASALPEELTLRVHALLQRKHLHDSLRRNLRDGLQAAVTDPLTGLFNRRYVDYHLTRMRDQSTAAGSELAVMMIDIDHFKAINDTHGHAAGDRVLVALAGRLRDNLRAVDLVARIGGEEFLIALPRTTAAQAQRAANRLRNLVNQSPFDLGEALPPVRVTISVGVALSGEASDNEKDTGQICHLADAALYRAKSAGRDRVAMHRSVA